MRLARNSRIAKGGTRGTVFKEVAQLRLADAKSLLEQKRFNGAIYMAGYAVECHLKYAACQRCGETYLPPNLEVHDWDILVKAAGLLSDIKSQKQVSLLYYALVEVWGPSLRYRTTKYSNKEALQLYKELSSLYQFFAELEP